MPTVCTVILHAESPYLKSRQHLFLARMIEDARKRDNRIDGKLSVVEQRLQDKGCSIFDAPVVSCLEDLDWLHKWIHRPPRRGRPTRDRPDPTAKLIHRFASKELGLLLGRLKPFPKHLLISVLSDRLSNIGRASLATARNPDKSLAAIKKQVGRWRDPDRAARLLIGRLKRLPDDVKGLTVGHATSWLELERQRRREASEQLIQACMQWMHAAVGFRTVTTRIPVRLPHKIREASIETQAAYMKRVERKIWVVILATCIEGLVDRGFSAYRATKSVLEPLLPILFREYDKSAPGKALRLCYDNMRRQKD